MVKIGNIGFLSACYSMSKFSWTHVWIWKFSNTHLFLYTCELQTLKPLSKCYSIYLSKNKNVPTPGLKLTTYESWVHHLFKNKPSLSKCCTWQRQLSPIIGQFDKSLRHKTEIWRVHQKYVFTPTQKNMNYV